jgi:hypothetical protein
LWKKKRDKNAVIVQKHEGEKSLGERHKQEDNNKMAPLTTVKTYTEVRSPFLASSTIMNIVNILWDPIREEEVLEI